MSILSIFNPLNVAGALSLLNPFNIFEWLEPDGSRTTPSLPQNDSHREQRARARQLKRTRRQFQWNTNVPSLTGVPLAKSVPVGDMPTVLWWEKVLETTLTIVENTLAIKNGNNPEETEILQGLRDQLKAIQNLNSVTPEFISDIIDAFVKLTTYGATHYASDLIARITDALMRFPIKGDAHIAETGLAAYQALFKDITLNQLQEDFFKDDVFAYYRVGGPNSVLIEKLESIPANLKLDATLYQQTMQSIAKADDTLEQALADNRLFVVDYKALQYLSDNTGYTNGQPKHLFSPIGLFALAPASSDDTKNKQRQLLPVAIQTDQTGNNVVYAQPLKSKNGYWEWQSAKAILQMADGNYHELFVHLARTHLVEEAFKVATERQFAREHPLFLLLTPHFEGTLFINSQAASDLIADGGPINQIFAGEIHATQYAAAQDRLGFDFYNHMLPTDLARRGVSNPDILPNYPYRDDATLIWNDINNWVSEYIHIYYKSNADVINDTELQAWVTEVMNEGRIAGFKPIKTIEQLIEVITMVIFTASAQHAAVNFPQATMMTYSPAISGTVWGESPLNVKTEAQWLSMFAPLTESWVQQSLLFLLGGVLYRPLGKYVRNSTHKEDWFRDPKIVGAGMALSRFQDALEKTQHQIETSIAKRPAPSKAQYTYLLPKNIPMSINI